MLPTEFGVTPFYGATKPKLGYINNLLNIDLCISLFRHLTADAGGKVCGATILYSAVGAGALAPLLHRVPEGTGLAGLVLEVAEVVPGQQALQQRLDPTVVEPVHRVHLAEMIIQKSRIFREVGRCWYLLPGTGP